MNNTPFYDGNAPVQQQTYSPQQPQYQAPQMFYGIPLDPKRAAARSKAFGLLSVLCQAIGNFLYPLNHIIGLGSYSMVLTYLSAFLLGVCSLLFGIFAVKYSTNAKSQGEYLPDATSGFIWGLFGLILGAITALINIIPVLEIMF